jgi:twitching motility protein PilT
MPEFLSDPELDRMIQEMNELAERRPQPPVAEEGGGPVALDAPTLRQVHGDEPLQVLLTEMVRRHASDLVLIPGSRPVLRVDGRLFMLDAPNMTGDAVRALFAPHLGQRSARQLTEAGAADLSLRLVTSAADAPGEPTAWRLRVNLQRQRGELAAAVRLLPHRIPTLEELNLPPDLARLVQPSRGLVLLCGPTGSGKSTTLAALLDVVNRTAFRHVITIEEPVEYEHVNGRSIFEQVEVGSDAPTFAHALRSALRRDPDVILVGEMRDLETISTAVTAAETGHLILSTLHTSDSTQALHRVIDVFPAGQQQQIRHQLALSLNAVVCQQLVPRADGRGRVPALELLIATYAIRNQIRKGEVHRIYNDLLAGREMGMRTLETSLAELVRTGVISADEARARCARPDELERML